MTLLDKPVLHDLRTPYPQQSERGLPLKVRGREEEALCGRLAR